jgi:hypothetical protein
LNVGDLTDDFKGVHEISSGIRALLFSFAEYLAACCEDEGEENPP